jgi:hypothetical protein
VASSARGATRKPPSSAGHRPHNRADDDYDTEGGRGTKADRDRLVREMRERDRRAQAAYHAGRGGTPLPEDASDQERLAHQAGAEEAAQPAAGPPGGGRARPRTRSGGGRRHSPWTGPAKPWLSPQGPGVSSSPIVATAQGATQKISQQGSGLFLGMIVYCVGVNFLRYGSAGVTGWIAAKFWNKPMGSSSSSSTGEGSEGTNSSGDGANSTHNAAGGKSTGTNQTQYPGGPKVTTS